MYTIVLKKMWKCENALIFSFAIYNNKFKKMQKSMDFIKRIFISFQPLFLIWTHARNGQNGY